MREYGLPKLLAWRWTPCAALSLGAAAFAAFALLVIPDQIGELGAATQNAAARLSLSNGFASTQTSDDSAGNWAANNAPSPGAAAPNAVAHVSAARPTIYPKRGFSPPLERVDPPPPPVPPPPPALTLQLPPQPPVAAEPVPAPPQAPSAVETPSAPPADAQAAPPAPAAPPAAVEASPTPPPPASPPPEPSVRTAD
jgi:outer membrane biosynthesis protein TonB